MALTTDEIRANYPLPVYNYRVEIGGDPVAFSEVAGLSIARETTTFKESPIANGVPGPRVMHMPAQRTAPKITLKKGVVPAVSIKVLYEWISKVSVNQVDKKDVVVRLCDEEGRPVLSWTIHNAFPTKLDAPTFDAKSNDAAIESMELMADFITLDASS